MSNTYVLYMEIMLLRDCHSAITYYLYLPPHTYACNHWLLPLTFCVFSLSWGKVSKSMLNIQLTGTPQPLQTNWRSWRLPQVKTTLDFHRLCIDTGETEVYYLKLCVTACIINLAHSCLLLSIIVYSNESIFFAGLLCKLKDVPCYQKIGKTIQDIFRKVKDN